jgi:transcription elongation factor
VTDVDTATARNLVDSMSNEVVVSDHKIRDVVPGEPISYDEAVGRALAARKARLEREAQQAHDAQGARKAHT